MGSSFGAASHGVELAEIQMVHACFCSRGTRSRATMTPCTTNSRAGIRSGYLGFSARRKGFPPVAAQSGVTAIAAGGYHSVALLGTAPPPSFAGWVASFGLSGTPDADPDHDGLASGLEYIRGGNLVQPSPTTQFPATSFTADSMIFTFSRADAAESLDVTLTVESDTVTLTWDRVSACAAAPIAFADKRATRPVPPAG
jgi:hypothetical protein